MKLIRCFSIFIFTFSFSFNQAQDPPANNAYSTATALSVQTGSCSSLTQGDLTHATNTNNSDFSLACIVEGFYGKPAYADVWYKATVPASGRLAVETFSVTNSELFSTILTAFTLSGDTLTEIACSYNKPGNSYFAALELTEQTAGTEIYFMVVDGDQIDYNNAKTLGPFDICAYEPPGPPANNAYSTATALSVQAGSCSSPTQGT